MENMELPSYMDAEQREWDTTEAKNEYYLDTRFVIRDGKRHPAAIIAPGGGYFFVASFVEGVPFARKLNEMGISAFIVYYRVRELAHYPAPQDDLARAVREVICDPEKWDIDPNNYSVWGSSAGGHLAATFGTESLGYKKYGLPKPGAMVLIYPVITMDREFTHMGTHDNLIGADATAELEDAWSVEKQVTAAYPPTYVWCGDADDAVPPENTKQMAAALEKAGVPVKMDIFPGIGHGVGLAPDTSADGWIDRAVEFWRGR